MPSHVHVILGIEGARLGAFMRDFKKYIAQKSAVVHGIRSDRIWMPRYDRVEIVSPKVLRTKLQYMHDNPVKATLVTSSEDWPWSSARAYAGRDETVIPVWREWA
ncbi:MAG: hypothetical protein HY851_04710 [candidate division Zixibacteria bacterium]|nr:hypothetical protein [candidate division Zixibacteria bacterium]